MVQLTEEPRTKIVSNIGISDVHVLDWSHSCRSSVIMTQMLLEILTVVLI